MFKTQMCSMAKTQTLKKRSINSLRSLGAYKKLIPPPDLLEEDMIESLANIGGKIINLAYRSSTFRDRTYNLRDSYVSAVFKNGHFVKGTDRYVTGEKIGSPSNISLEYDYLASGDPEMATGREEAKKFIAKWGFSRGRPGGIVLVVAATMFYSGIVEAHKYWVISHINDELEALAKNGYTTMKYKAHIDAGWIEEPSIYREGGTGRMEIING